MKIRYKLIEHERFEDAPFVGCLISSIDCSLNCKNCFNQHLKQYQTIIKDSKDIINEIINNPFNEGIILGGLEWTEQFEELIELINLSLQQGLKVMLYTGLEEKEFKERFPQIYNQKIYIKFGRYDESKKNNNNQWGVNLSTTNQKIMKGG